MVEESKICQRIHDKLGTRRHREIIANMHYNIFFNYQKISLEQFNFFLSRTHRMHAKFSRYKLRK